MDQEKISAMRAGGKIMGQVMKSLRQHVRSGMTGREVDAWVRGQILQRGAGVAYDMLDDTFPGAICISVNDALVHGVPDDYVFQVGDKVSFDLDIYYKGYFTDSAFTMIIEEHSIDERRAEMTRRVTDTITEQTPSDDYKPTLAGDGISASHHGIITGVGQPVDRNIGSAAVRRMMSVTESAMWEGISLVRAGVHLGDVGYAVEKVLKKGKLGVIENYIGHGIGKEMHMSPDVPNYGRRGTGYVLRAGDTICIEPMSALGRPKNYVDTEDGWTVRMRDGSYGCHYEHTVLVLEDGYEVLTAWPD